MLAAALGLWAGACSKAPHDAGPAPASPRSPDMTTSSSGGSGHPVKQRAPSPPAAAPPRSERVYPETVDGIDALPRVTSAADVKAHDGALVRVTGTYVERDVRMRADPPPVHLGHVAIKLADGSAVAFLTAWSKDGPRPVAEIERLAGTQVDAVGTIFALGIPRPQGGNAAAEPTLVDIKALRPAR